MSKYLRNKLGAAVRNLLTALMLSAGIAAHSFAASFVDVTIGVRPSHNVPPGRVTALSALTGIETGWIKLDWTMPPTEWNIQITDYYLRWHTKSINDNPYFGDKTAWWDGAAGGQNESNYWNPADTVTYTAISLTPGTTYYFGIKVKDEFGNESDYDEKMYNPPQANARAAWDGTPPDPVTTLSALTGTVEGEIILSWIAPGDDGAINDFDTGSLFVIKYSTTDSESPAESDAKFDAASSIECFCAIPTPSTAGKQESITLTGLTAGVTYYFAMKTRDEVPNWSEISNGATTWAQVDVTPPAAVTDLAAETSLQDNEILLSWTAPGDNDWTGNLTGQFAIFYSTTPGEAEASHYDNAQIIISTTNCPPVTSYQLSVTGLTSDTTYYFVLWTADEVPNWSGLSNVTTGWTRDDIAPSAPIGLTAIAGNEEVTLFWTKNAETDVESYNIYRSTNQTAWSVVGSTTSINYNDINLENNVTYWYRITAVDTSSNESSTSTVVSAMPYLLDGMAPAAVTDFAAATSLQDNEILLSWTSPGDDGTVGNLTGQFAIFRSTIPGEAETSDYGDAQIIISTSGVSPGTGIQYPVTGLEGDKIYYFVIWTADEIDQWSALSNIAAGRTRDNVAPSAPAGLTAIAGDKEVSLSWMANAEPDMNIYKIYKATYPVLTVSDYDCSVSTLQTAKIITGLTNFVTYYFKITAVDASGNESSYSALVSTMPVDMMAPENPVGIYGEISSDGKTFTLRWSAVVRNVLVDEETPFDDLAGYKVYRSTSKLGPFDFVVTVSTTQTQCSVTKETDTYYYAVRAFDTTGNESEMSALIDNTAQTNLWIISRSTDGVFVDAIIKIPSAFNEKLRSACDDDDVVIRGSQDVGYPKGRILKSFNFTPKENISGDEVKVAFDQPLIEIKIFYYDVVAGGSSVKSLRANAAGITDPEKELAILWFNGVEWIKLGGEVNTDEKSVGIFTSHLGKYQLRRSVRLGYPNVLSGPTPKVFTPNGDGFNDVCGFTYQSGSYAPSGEIFDLRGRKVADMKTGSWITDDSLTWDGKDNSGNFTAPGVYIWQIKSGGKVENGTVVVAK